MAFYDEALARIQQSDYGGVAEDAAPGIVRHLHKAGFRQGRLIDLGCGAGPLARALEQAGYHVIGIEGSRALVRIAKAQASDAKIVVGNVHTIPFPKAVAICAVGEVLQYLRPGREQPLLPRLLRKAHMALQPGGLILFDLIVERMVPAAQQYQAQGAGWEIAIDAVQDGPVLKRALQIQRGGEISHEIHHQHIWSEEQILRWMRQADFRAVSYDSYGTRPVFPRRRVFIGYKIG